MRFFNTAGPVNPEKHYFIPHRLPEDDVKILIEQEKYFVLHAPRQSGKTTAIMQFVKQLNSDGLFKVLYVNVEPAQAIRGDIDRGMSIIIKEFINAAQEHFGNDDTIFAYAQEELKSPSGSSLGTLLRRWAHASDKPIILFIDEIDSLVGDTLISVLRQLRAGYASRPKFFPQSVCLIGVRDVRDYRIWSVSEGGMILGGSAFNIKAESLKLADFTVDQVRDLYEQHTRETGQPFTTEAIAYAYAQTQGQPWLVNALAYQACFRDVKDRSQLITQEVMERARETLILRRDTHLDVLIDRLQEPRVRAIIEAIVSGREEPENFPVDDIAYVRDLGLLKRSGTRLAIANPIYQEVIPRELTYTTQLSITQQTVWYIDKQGMLDMHTLLEAFTQFYRENSDVWLEKFAYKESGPHLLLMAFLQRVINGGGKLHREYALGRGRVDLLVEWESQRIVIELKVRRGTKTLQDGLVQTASYMDTCHATEGHLVIFDRTPGASWEDKIYQHIETVGSHKISVWGM